MSIDNRFTAVGLIAILLLAGIVIGVGVDRTWLHRDSGERGWRMPPPFETRVAHFRERLGLSDQQAAEIEAILDDARAEADAIHERFEPEMRAVRDRSRTRLRAVLTPEQAVAYDKMSQEFERRRPGSMRGRGPGGRHGGPGGKGRGPGDHGRRSAGPGHFGSGDRPGRAGFEQRIEELDSDHDGQLSRAECQASDHPFARRIDQEFDQIDHDGDGKLSAAELEDFGNPRRNSPL